VIREIKKIKRQGGAIVVVRYRGTQVQEQHPSWQVDNRLLGAIGNYQRVAYVTKTRADGSRVVLKAIRRWGFPIANLKVVGVNTDCCVASTVNSLSSGLPDSNIWLVADACNTEGCSSRSDGRSFLARRKNIHRVNIPKAVMRA
jgi:hypothetical protein